MQKKIPLWRQTPPAIFPVCLGFMGLGLAWRNGSEVIPIPHEIGDLLLGLSTAFLIYFLLIFFAKVAARPSVVFDDLKVAPARAGVAAVPMSIMLLAAALLPFNVHVPEVWWFGVVMQFLAILLVSMAILRDPPEIRHFSPFQYLSFVGPIVAPIAGISLGFKTESFWLAMFALVGFVVITTGVGVRLMRVRPPVPLRPSLAIILAPISLLALTFAQQDMDMAFTVFYWLAWVLAIVLLMASRWMMTGGWTPIWGAFTFPLATFANLQIVGMKRGLGPIAEFGAWAGLVIATPLILYIVYKASMAFISGDLAKKSAAAIA